MTLALSATFGLLAVAYAAVVWVDALGVSSWRR